MIILNVIYVYILKKDLLSKSFCRIINPTLASPGVCVNCAGLVQTSSGYHFATKVVLGLFVNCALLVQTNRGYHFTTGIPGTLAADDIFMNC